MSLELRQYDKLPEGFLETPVTELHALLGGPSLIHLPGPQPPLFVSTLLHGNETTGIDALQTVLREYANRDLPRALSIFIGNTAAAEKGRRLLPGQPDFNRIWPNAEGELPPGISEQAGELALAVMTSIRQCEPCAVLDLHNTSGRNPPHACVNVMSGDCIELAGQFAQRVLYFTRPEGVLSMAFSGICPAVTVESGAVGMPRHSELTSRYLQYVLERHFPAYSADQGNSVINPPGDVMLYRSVARVRVAEELPFSLDGSGKDFRLVPDIDGFNWRELSPGTRLAQLPETGDFSLNQLLHVTDPLGHEVGARFLDIDGDAVITRCAITPAMLSTDPTSSDRTVYAIF